MATPGNQYRLQIEHQWGDQKWLNTWRMRAIGAAAAENLAAHVLLFHRNIHADDIRINRARISTLQEDGRNFVPVPYSQDGTRDVDNFLPKVLTMNVDLTDGEWGDQGFKFFHLGFDRLHNTNGEIVSSVRTLVIQEWILLAGQFDAEAYLTTGGDNAIIGFTPRLEFGTHQFKRKWARRTPS